MSEEKVMKRERRDGRLEWRVRGRREEGKPETWGDEGEEGDGENRKPV